MSRKQPIPTFDSFWRAVRRINTDIAKPDAEIFFETYDGHDDYQKFLEKTLKRTRLTLAVVLDLETAYQTALAEIGAISKADALQSSEWNKILKLAEEKVGAEKFKIGLHGSPRFIFKNIINSFDFDKIVEKCYGS